VAWYDAINPWAGRDVGQKADYGLPGYADRAAGLQRAYQGAYGPDRQSSFRGGQQDLVGRLQRMASGEDSQSRAELQRSYGQATANQLGLAASARPGQGPMAARLAAQNVGRMQAGMAGDQALAGIAERNAATGQLAGVLGQARGQDIGQLQANDAFNQAMRQQELQNAELQQRGNLAFQGALAAQPSEWEKTAALFEGGAKAYANYATGGASGAAEGGRAKMADGGVVTRPTNALIGEAGPEAVIPLHRLPEILGRLAKMIKGGAAGRYQGQSPGEEEPLDFDDDARRSGEEDEHWTTPRVPPQTEARAKSTTWNGAYFPPVNVGDQDDGGYGRTRRVALDSRSHDADRGVYYEPVARTKQTARPSAPEPARAPVATATYGPPAPSATYGPPAPLVTTVQGGSTWHPADKQQMDIYYAAQRAAATRNGAATPNMFGPYGVPKGMSVGDWRALLAGLGVK
jgi:hypothetical protein